MIPHNRPTLGDAEQAAVARVLASGWIAQGREVESLEREFCAYLGLPDGHAVAVSSGSAALFLALTILGVRQKQVALPVYSCAALPDAVTLAGGRSLYMDVALGSPNVAPEEIASVAVDVVVAAHMFGNPIDLRTTGDTLVVEDCAQALVAKVGGVPVGLHGAIGIYSFYATKLITAGGQGGMVVSSNRAIVDAVRDYRQFDHRADRTPRFNFQMTDIQAAIARAQLSRLDSFLSRRAEIFNRYREAGVTLLDAPGAVRFRVVLRTTEPEKVIARLAEAGVSAIIPVETWEILDCPEAYPFALDMARTTVSLPVYPSLSDKELAVVLDCLH